MSAKIVSAPMAIIMLLFCLSQSSSAADAQGIQELEPNSRPEEAQPITVPGTISGTFSAWAEKDIYALTAPPEGLPSLYIVLEHQTDLNPTLELLNENGQVLTKSDFFGNGLGEYLTSLKLEPGEYLLQVNRHASKEVEGLPYTLSVDHIPPVSPEEVRQALDKALDYLISQQGEDGGFPLVKLGIVSAPAFVIQALLGAECLERAEDGDPRDGPDREDKGRVLRQVITLSSRREECPDVC